VIFVKVIALCVPIVLFFLGLPNAGFSKDWVERRLGTAEDISDLAKVDAKEGDMLVFDLQELNMAANDESKRAAFEGRLGTLDGQLRTDSEKSFTLFKMKMACCAADQIPLQARVVTDFVPSTIPYGEWVRAEGIVQFIGKPDKTYPDRKQYTAVIRVTKASGLVKTTPK